MKRLKSEKIEKNKPCSNGSRLKLTLALLSNQTLTWELVHNTQTWKLASNIRNK